MNRSAKVLILISFFLLSASSNLNLVDAFYGSSSPVLQLTPSNFKSKVVNSNSVVLVEFFAPWCGHCQALTPIWEKAASVLKGVATVAAIDADANPTIAQEYGIKGFPTIKVFVPGKPPVDYQGAREAKPIAEFALKQVKALLKDRLSGKTTTTESSEKKSEPNLSVELTSNNFDEMVVKSKDLWVVEFFAPWCGHCKKLAPEWKKAAKNLQGKVKLGHVNCDDEKSLMSRFKVQGFPTILVFGADKESPITYEGARTASAIESFALVQLETNVAPPEVTELTSSDVMEEKCGSAAICFVSFLPDILDSKAEGRNKYIEMLLSVAEKFKRSPYRKPFRLLPFGVQPKLTNDEMTILRRLGRPLPCHFALGRNRKHQGLAAAILKLWEKCEIAKIAVKKGVQNTNSELMAKELQWLTGGTLLTRDKEYIVLYRGKDFLPSSVSSAIEQRRNHGVDEFQRNKTPNSSSNPPQVNQDNGTQSSSVSKIGEISDQKLEIAIEQRKQRSREAAIKKTSSKLSQALENKEKAEKLLEELEKEETKQQFEVDKEGITEEERYMLRKVGMKMKPFLLLGRRGVFDGTVENMHLHWKYRELVKILSGESSIDELHAIARTLEAESGGILVAIERMRKGHAIIIYRGKNYKRPPSLRPQTLLNKREALKRSIEAQRTESLKLHVLKLGKNVEELKLKLAKNEEICIQGEKDEVAEEHEKEKSSSTECMEEPNANIELHNHNPNPNPTKLKEIEVDLDFSNKNNGLQIQSSSQENPETNESEFTEANNSSKLSLLTNKTEFRVTESNGRQHRSVLLSNKERLLLRKQALKTTKRPVLAVGRRNVVSGVAKTIKTHFQKHPLAIVNIKGRAKGTSVQELVSKLEEATGAILVSQEPNKVILYRGWGATTTTTTTRDYNKKVNEKHEDEEGIVKKTIISPELISAIKYECGLEGNIVHEREGVS